MTTLIGDTLSAPPPGSTAIGDLYVDLQTRTMWMGVDAAVDPAEAVLLSDIMSIQPTIDEAIGEAKLYTDNQIATRAPLVHTHTASQITDFDDAVADAIANNTSGGGFVKGMVMMYSGSMADIGVGKLAGWHLCDGSSGTPNMVDQFVIGAGRRSTGEVNAGKSIKTDVAPAHTHTINGTALTIANLPAHTHSVSGSGSGTGTAAYAGDHQHSFPVYGGDGGRSEGAGGNGTPGLLGNYLTSVGGGHTHGVNVNVNITGTAASVGSTTTHTHTAAIGGAHDHTLTAADLRDSLPYFVIAFIMKL